MKRVGLITSAVALAAAGVAYFAPHAYAVANTCTWTGTAGDSKFSTATNWSNCNSSVPQTGDIILLPYISATSVSLVNDLPQGTLLGGLTLDTKQGGGTSSTDYTVDSLAFSDGAVVSRTSGRGLTVSSAVTFAGSVTFDNTSQYIFTAPDSGKTMTATNVTINNPTLTSSCSGAGGGYYYDLRPTGNVSIGASTWYGMVGTEASVTVGSRAMVSLPQGTYAGNITFNTGGAAQAPACGADSAYSMADYSDTTLSGTLTLNSGDVMYTIGTGKTLTVTGTINGNGAGLKPYVESTGTFVNNASNNNSTTPGGSQTVPMQTLPTVSDSQPAVNLDMVSNTTLSFDGIRNRGFVPDKAVLMGGGTFQSELFIAPSGRVAPGHSPGCLTSDTLTLRGDYQFEIGGTDPCTGYDQLIVKNAANAAGAVTLDDTTSTLTTSRYNNYTPKQGQVFVIIDQAGDKAVVKTFKGLPEGATFEQNGVVFKISYVGGDGNDVTLTVQNVPTAPSTGFAIVKSNPVLIAGGTIFAALLLAGIARFAKR